MGFKGYLVAGAVGIACIAAAPAHAQETLCYDSLDNDGDLKIDCGDSDCKNEPKCACHIALRKAGPKFAAALKKLLKKCVESVEKGKLPLSTDCNPRLIEELAYNHLVNTTVEYGGKVSKARNNYTKAFIKGCGGPDGVLGTVDDAEWERSSECTAALTPFACCTGPGTGTCLDYPATLTLGTVPLGLEVFHEELVSGVFVNPPGSTNGPFESDVEETVLYKGPLGPWLAKPRSQRILELLIVAQVDEIKAEAEKEFLVKGAEGVGTGYTSRMVKPEITYDAGADLEAPGGVNDTISVPSASACPLPGIGACADDPTITCSMAPGSGVNLFCVSDINGVCAAFGVPFPCCTGPGTAACGCYVEAGTPGDFCPPAAPCGGAPCCIEALSGPDGVTAADAPAGSAGFAKALVRISDDAAGTRHAYFKCWADDVENPPGTPVTTTLPGTCDCALDPSCIPGACTESADCDASSPSRYACLSGDEYHCQLDGLAGSNADGIPPAGSCLAVLVPGPPGTACGFGGGGLCAIGVCVGGARAGQSCDITGVIGCPSGACTAGAPAILSGDEVGFFAPAFGGMGYLTAPFKFRLDVPMEVVGGETVAEGDFAGLPVNLCIPDGTQVQVQGAYLHEPGADSSGLLQFYLGGAGLSFSHDKIPCPDVALPLPSSSTGLPTSAGVGPIIGATGVRTP